MPFRHEAAFEIWPALRDDPCARCSDSFGPSPALGARQAPGRSAGAVRLGLEPAEEREP
jgi:hypothetical protein